MQYMKYPVLSAKIKSIKTRSSVETRSSLKPRGSVETRGSLKPRSSVLLASSILLLGIFPSDPASASFLKNVMSKAGRTLKYYLSGTQTAPKAVQVILAKPRQFSIEPISAVGQSDFSQTPMGGQTSAAGQTAPADQTLPADPASLSSAIKEILPSEKGFTGGLFQKPALKAPFKIASSKEPSSSSQVELSSKNEVGPSLNYTDLGFYRVAAVSPIVEVGNPMENAAIVLKETQDAVKKGASVVVFPELGLTGYTAEDLFSSESLIDQTVQALSWLKSQTQALEVVLVVGAPYRTVSGRLYNVAFVISKGKIIGAVPKSHLPNYGEFYDRRWFVSGKTLETDVDDSDLGKFHLGRRQLFKMGSLVLGIEICEDLWAPQKPSTKHALMGANVILNLSASNELIGKAGNRKDLVSRQASDLNAAYIYAASGPTESTKDIVFSGHSIIAENGTTLAESKRFQLDGERIFADIDIQRLLNERMRNTTFGNSDVPKKEYRIHKLDVKSVLPTLARTYSKTPFVQASSELEEILEIQATGLARRLMSARFESALIGVSGGLDSTLALLVTVEAAKKLKWSPEQIIGVTMPGFGTSKGTRTASLELMKSLNITSHEIGIGKAVEQHFEDIGQDPSVHDVVYENSQARERTQILFDLANKYKGIVVGTGDLSELCLGWCTFNGDHMSNYNVNVSIPKTMVKDLISWYALNRSDSNVKTILQTVLSTEISPELLPPSEDGRIKQSTESLVGPYRLHDFFIYHHLRNGFGPKKIFYLAVQAFGEEYSPAEIKKWLRVFIDRFYKNQFKRTTLPPGPKAGPVGISPRGDLRLPDEISFKALLSEVDALPVK